MRERLVRLTGPLLVQFDQITMAHAAALHGPRSVAQEAAVAWNIHEWELR